eukprot:TRINITY_DN2074_c0_g1_i1.p2 TRINITY_DN2074_c0_g1~~TRINITY_DN2074_c0_g1_i1.p2  ORF type:complete len:126 (-),score=29.37 TRINITY_DN2074_c0_g1_i1:58-435(-)
MRHLHIDKEKLESIPSLKQYYEAFEDWNWRFGKTPEFTHQIETRFPWGSVGLHVLASQGVILQNKIWSDSLYPQMIDILSEELTGVPYNSEGMDKARKRTKERLAEDVSCHVHLDQFYEWVIQNL